MSKLLFDEDDTSNDNDFMLALQMQMQIDDDDEIVEEPLKTQKPLKKIQMPPTISSLGDPELDLIDPCPDIRAMFVEFDKLYFWSRLGSCLVEWSKRMTICAGIFYLRGGGVIRLSEPLLKFRPRKDLVETLLHEMIHAYLYLTRNFKDRGDHGDEFKSHMNRINSAARTNISVYHSFHDEVNFQRQHVWRCNGACV
jgi:predicted SprT family Zn-dependent metalloprotease